ncbi:MAG: DNA-directed RNA polymerase subunit beta [Ignavibacteria bacterium]|nr:DNA-directed RNA polymerase subunit beta [Ignavibacteria bacterium]
MRLRKRITFSRSDKNPAYPDLLDIQLHSFSEFLQENAPPSKRRNIGLQSAFIANFPIEDASGIYQLEFIDFSVEKPKNTENECRERELTYAKPLKAKLRLSSRAEKDSEDYIEAVEQEVYLGNIPVMTDRGTFIINGAERVIVNQIHRSPGVFFGDAFHPNGTRIYSARIIPFRGSWVDFTTDIHDVMYAYIDRKKKFPVTTLLRAIGFSSDEEILALFDLTTDVTQEQLDETYLGRRIASEIVDLGTGEIIAGRDEIITEALLNKVSETEIPPLKIFSYTDSTEEPVIARTIAKDKTRNREEALEEVYRQLRTSEAPDIETAWGLIEKLFFNPKRYDLGEVGRFRINDKLGLDIPIEHTTITVEDIISTIKYLLKLHSDKTNGDDIDHLGNRRVRSVGEQLASQINVGLARMTRTIRERLGVKDDSQLTPAELVNARTISSVINQFFGTNQLSQFMDQTNPLAELTHKRRTSALGPGGLTRERAGFEVRDVHYTHYGRLCPIETPEGPNIGLISSLALHGRINDLGFIETAYRKVIDGVLTNDIIYITAEIEDKYITCPASTIIDEKGVLQGDKIRARYQGDYVVVSPKEIQLMDVSTDQIASAAAALIPFLEHDDANRALMGSNMQRQAVPLLRPTAPIVGTGMEARIARDSRALLVAEGNGKVEYVSSNKIKVLYDDIRNAEEKLTDFTFKCDKTYDLVKYFRTNQDTCINQRPIVRNGDRVVKGQPLADNSSTEKGELALGRNILVAFMPWNGYNFEDAIIISERMVAKDVFTSIHIEEFSLQVRDTKRGIEEFTKEIPNISEEATKDLDDDGIVRIGAKIIEGDILIGKITPKGETDPTPEEKLLRAIFGDKAGDVKDVSMKATPGIKGIVINTKLFTRKFVTEKEGKQTEKKKQDAINRLETRQCKELSLEFMKRWTGALGDVASLGLRLTNGVVIVKAGSKYKPETLMSKFTDGTLDLELLPTEYDYVADGKQNGLINTIVSNFQAALADIKADFKAQRYKLTSGDELQPGILQMAKVYLAKKRKLQVGDKMAGRHGNKGIVSKIVPVEDMPFLPDGTSVEIVLNPLGVPSRMNLGQLYETALGWAGYKLGVHFATPIFDGATWDQVGDFLEKAGLPRTGKSMLFDGKTGDQFDELVTIGIIYMLKLSHLVEDKMHARSIGPYSLITQQPLGGKAQFGGQRLGEMEVWALEAYGAAHTLREMITQKSDDVTGRAKMYEAIVKGDNIPPSNVPESFHVLQRELQGLCLDLIIE